MTDKQIENVTIIGAGVLGGQIAWHSAFRGKSVVVYDLYEESLDQCRTAQQTYAHIYSQDFNASESMLTDTRSRLIFTTNLPAAVANADLVIEAVSEIADVKIQLYHELVKHLPEHTIIATTTSTLLPSQFAEETGRPQHYCALHFANLIWAFNLAEIMAHATTSDETLIAVTQFSIEIGMVPIPVQKEHNGYVLNSIGVMLVNAAQSLITNGVASPENIDRTYMIMNRGCSMGPCGLIDMVGMTTMYNILSHWSNENNDEQMKRNAQYLQQHFLDTGLMGLQTGEGYYKYPRPSYQAADFLEVPNVSQAENIALMDKLS